MTADTIMEFVSERGDAISRADLVRLNEMLFELQIEDVSDVRGWVMESIWLKVADPLYEGDIELTDIE